MSSDLLVESVALFVHYNQSPSRETAGVESAAAHCSWSISDYALVK